MCQIHFYKAPDTQNIDNYELIGSLQNGESHFYQFVFWSCYKELKASYSNWVSPTTDLKPYGEWNYNFIDLGQDLSTFMTCSSLMDF